MSDYLQDLDFLAEKGHCVTCDNKGHIRKHWAPWGDRISYHTWLEECPECGPTAQRLKELCEEIAIKKEVKEIKDFEIVPLAPPINNKE